MKTNPRVEMLQAALGTGFFAECISSGEIAAALAAGFERRALVYNGPQPLHRAGLEGPLGVALADSVAALAGNIGSRVADVQGMRMRPDWHDSRFGISSEQTGEAIAALRALPADASFAVSFHVRAQDYDGRSWLQVARTFLRRAVEIQRLADRPIVAFDVGGGWKPAQLEETLRRELPTFVGEAADALTDLRTIFLEPGQSVATPTQFMISSVLEVRSSGSRVEAVIDAGYPNLPLQGTYAHRVFVEDGERWTLLPEGPDRILGPTCLEYDVVASNVSLPPAMRPATQLCIADCGSYDASMALHFARGEERTGLQVSVYSIP
ncbi:MAG: hypothetical protein JO359_13350 [Candidatus Eremiobacteraeota bacterium]|nr:hypothetical protein [Candidatus Eremiobacteraeota bacterium]